MNPSYRFLFPLVSLLLLAACNKPPTERPVAEPSSGGEVVISLGEPLTQSYMESDSGESCKTIGTVPDPTIESVQFPKSCLVCTGTTKEYVGTLEGMDLVMVKVAVKPAISRDPVCSHGTLFFQSRAMTEADWLKYQSDHADERVETARREAIKGLLEAYEHRNDPPAYDGADF